MGAPVDLASAVLSPIYPDTAAGRRAEAARQARWAQRLEQYQQACTLRQQGLPMPHIARQVGVSTRTLCRWWAADAFPERHAPGVFVCGGFTGHGMAFGPASAELVATLVRDGTHPYADLFDPSR